MTAATASANIASPAPLPTRGTTHDRAQPLNHGQTAAVALAISVGVLVAGYGFAGSYTTLSELAARHDVPLPGLVPAGIDGGLAAIVLLDLTLAWIDTAVGWLRQLVRILSIGTVAANASSGWPDPIAVGLHIAAPVMLLAMIEAGRTVLHRRISHTHDTLRDPIPLPRWTLAPWRTWLLWRRMVLWQHTSYRHALDTELELRQAVALLRVRYGPRWRHHAPPDLVWMLRTGTHLEQACARVHAEMQTDGGTGNRQPTPPPPADITPDHTAAPPGPVDAPTEPPQDTLGEVVSALRVRAPDRQRFAEAVRLNQDHWARTGRPISAETLRKRLRLGATKSRQWCQVIREHDRKAVCGNETNARRWESVPDDEVITRDLDGSSAPNLTIEDHLTQTPDRSTPDTAKTTSDHRPRRRPQNTCASAITAPTCW